MLYNMRREGTAEKRYVIESTQRKTTAEKMRAARIELERPCVRTKICIPWNDPPSLQVRWGHSGAPLAHPGSAHTDWGRKVGVKSRLCYVTLCYVMLVAGSGGVTRTLHLLTQEVRTLQYVRYIMLCYVILRYVMSCYAMICCVSVGVTRRLHLLTQEARKLL
jgi:hypothetical protein